MAKAGRIVEGRWRIVETERWDREALDLVVPAHITFERNGMGEMQLIAIGASIDYRVEERGSVPVVEFSWLGFARGTADKTLFVGPTRDTILVSYGVGLAGRSLNDANLQYHS